MTKPTDKAGFSILSYVHGWRPAPTFPMARITIIALVQVVG